MQSTVRSWGSRKHTANCWSSIWINWLCLWSIQIFLRNEYILFTLLWNVVWTKIGTINPVDDHRKFTFHCYLVYRASANGLHSDWYINEWMKNWIFKHSLYSEYKSLNLSLSLYLPTATACSFFGPKVSYVIQQNCFNSSISYELGGIWATVIRFNNFITSI